MKFMIVCEDTLTTFNAWEQEDILNAVSMPTLSFDTVQEAIEALAPIKDDFAADWIEFFGGTIRKPETHFQFVSWHPEHAGDKAVLVGYRKPAFTRNIYEIRTFYVREVSDETAAHWQTEQWEREERMERQQFLAEHARWTESDDDWIGE